MAEQKRLPSGHTGRADDGAAALTFTGTGTFHAPGCTVKLAGATDEYAPSPYSDTVTVAYGRDASEKLKAPGLRLSP